jgi:hypothetical protein
MALYVNLYHIVVGCHNVRKTRESGKLSSCRSLPRRPYDAAWNHTAPHRRWFHAQHPLRLTVGCRSTPFRLPSASAPFPGFASYDRDTKHRKATDRSSIFILSAKICLIPLSTRGSAYVPYLNITLLFRPITERQGYGVVNVGENKSTLRINVRHKQPKKSRRVIPAVIKIRGRIVARTTAGIESAVRCERARVFLEIRITCR